MPIPLPAALAGFGISIVAVLVITFVYTTFVRGRGAKFWDIIREKDWHPSLARFQFLIWTWVVLFAFFAIFLIQIFGGVFQIPDTMPDQILILMGISVTPAIISSATSKKLYDIQDVVQRPPTPIPLSDMLLENEKPTITRFQMFAWTFISVTAYLVILFSAVANPLVQPVTLALPDVPPLLVFLMGLSQGGYLVGKFAKGT